MHDSKRSGGEDCVRPVRRNPGSDRVLGVERLEPQLHQCLRAHHSRRRSLHHRDLGTTLPEVRRDVVRRTVGAYDDTRLAGVGIAVLVAARVAMPPLKRLDTWQRNDVRRPVSASREHELLGSQGRARSIADDINTPFRFLFIVFCVNAFGGRPIVQLHHLSVHFQPVTDLVLGREDGPVLGKGNVRQMVVPDRIMQDERAVAVAPQVSPPARSFPG